MNTNQDANQANHKTDRAANQVDQEKNQAMDFFKKRTETGAVSSWKKRRYPPLLPPENKNWRQIGAISGLQQTVLRSKTDAMRSERT